MPALTAALMLACVGGGTAIKPDSATISGSNSGTTSGSYDYGRGQYSGSYGGSFDGTVTGTRAQDYSDQVDVEINGIEGRIRLPRVVLPLVHGGDDGWFKLKKLEITDRAIDASARVNFINHPKVHIDRVKGTISITGREGNYTGRCEAVEASAQRKF